MSIQNILETMEYGVAPEDDSQARKWLAKHEGGFGYFIDGAMTNPWAPSASRRCCKASTCSPSTPSAARIATLR